MGLFPHFKCICQTKLYLLVFVRDLTISPETLFTCWTYSYAMLFRRLLECISHSYGNTSSPFFLSTETAPKASSVVPVQSLLHPHCCCWVQNCHLLVFVSHSAALSYHFLIVCNSSRDCANSKNSPLITTRECSP